MASSSPSAVAVALTGTDTASPADVLEIRARSSAERPVSAFRSVAYAAGSSETALMTRMSDWFSTGMRTTPFSSRHGPPFGPACRR